MCSPEKEGQPLAKNAAGLKGTFWVKEIPPPTLPWELNTAIATVIAVAVVVSVATFLYRRRRSSPAYAAGV